MNDLLLVFLIAVSPFLESRAAIPVGVAMGMNPVALFLSVTAANLAIIPIIFFVLDKLFDFIPFLQKFADRAHKKSEKYLNKYGYMGLAVFVGFPVPGTGAYSGSLVAYLLEMNRKKAMLSIAVGVIFASAVMTIASAGIFTAINTFIPL